ncbi:hypothetical protein FOCC_FOCC013248 [Frankliniella occidentalis]|nr:hypothetical protein FOCC_FOCC013248 [Frankliniella occidentalis]
MFFFTSVLDSLEHPIAYRGGQEAAHSLEDRSVNHGNFLELVLLLAEYDPVLQEHVRISIETSKKLRDSNPGSKGRGSFVSFLSKSTVNKLIKIIGSNIQEKIIEEVKLAKIFSLQVDSTQDVGVLDQLAIVVRYVSPLTGMPSERLIKLTVSHDNTGEGLFKLIKREFASLGIDLRNCVACSFDGAANMSGCFKGLQTRLKEINPNLQFTHCAAHCLNLVLSDTCKDCNDCNKLFGLLETAAVFISQSYKRMEVWSSIAKASNSAHRKLRRLQKIGATRWWSKHVSLRSVIDEKFSVSENCNLVQFLSCMADIRDSSLFDSKTNFAAGSIITGWCKFETLLTAFLMSDVFVKTTPVSEALQSPKLDYLTTFKMVEALQDAIEKKRDEFDSLVSRVKQYALDINKELDALEIKDIKLETDFQDLRKTRHAHVQTSRDAYRVGTFYVVLDRVISGLRERFNPNEDLLKECAMLDPK